MLLKSSEESHRVSFGSGLQKSVLLKKISEMHDLPTLDVSIMKILKLAGDENVDINELVSAVERDQAIVAKLLKVVNSGYYALRSTITSVQRAVTLLGVLKLKQIIYSTAILDFFSKNDIVEWNHSYSTSVLMSRLIQDDHLLAAPALPLVMIMHDIGKVVLRRYSARQFTEAISRSLDDRIPLDQAEEIVIGINHAEVGGMLLEKWLMPPETYTLVIQHHMNEVPFKYVRETALVQLVNWVDCSARSIESLPPCRELLKASGFESLDSEHLLQEQRELIAASEGASAEKPAKSDKSTRSQI